MEQLSVVQVLGRLLFMGGCLVVSVLAWIYFVGMHNNTKDGNSFRLLNPLSLFDSSQFNDEGNRYRIALWKVVGVSAALGIVGAWALRNGW